jgi:hypothetical protein
MSAYSASAPAAEWALMIRNLFVREEGDILVLGSGLFPRWLQQCKPLLFGPTLTPFGPVTLSLQPEATQRFVVTLEARWRGPAPDLDVRVPGFSRVTPLNASYEFLIEVDA